MDNNVTKQRRSSTGQLVAKPLGKGKATKFALVEGISLNQRSASLITRLEQRGLKGDALRSAITRDFASKQG
jgi:hypothetical protein